MLQAANRHFRSGPSDQTVDQTGRPGSRRILFAAPPYFGHTNQLITLAQALRNRGHEVAFANHPKFAQRIAEAGVRFLEWDPEKELRDAEAVRRRRELWERASRDRRILRGETMMLRVAVDIYQPMYRTLVPWFEQINPELVVVDSALLPAIDLAQQTQTACIVLAQFLGNHVPTPPQLPRYGTPFRRQMNGRQRLVNWVYPQLTLLHFLPEILRLQKYRRSCGAPAPILEVYRRQLMLVSTAFGLELPRPLPPRVQMVGPILPENDEALAPDLLAWLQASAEPAVFVSFGTLALLDQSELRAIAAGLNGHRVLWGMPPDQQRLLGNYPESFRVESFLPQPAVLTHPAVRVFVTHCGMNSVSESLVAGKPMLAVPIFGDQHYNSARICDAGAGLRLRQRPLDPAKIAAQLKRLLQEPEFTRKAQQLSVILRRAGGLDHAVHWCETVLAVGDQFILDR